MNGVNCAVNRFLNRTFCAAIFFFLATPPARAEFLPSDRRIDWNPGVRGGLPMRTNLINVRNSPYDAQGDGVANDQAPIQAAINAASTGQVVYLPAGTYRIDSQLAFSKGISLRGDGPDKTVIKYTGSNSTDIISAFHPTALGSAVVIISGRAKGSTHITMADSTGFSTGDYVVISQNNPDWVTATGENGICSWCAYNNPGRTMTQVNRVTGKFGGTLTLERPLYFGFSNSPTATVMAMVEGAGIESLTVWRVNASADSGRNFNLYSCANSWICNVSSTNAGHRHVELFNCYACTVRDSAFWDGFDHGSDHSYGLFCFGWNSDHLFENNLLFRCRHSLIFEGGGSGCVFGYNCAVGVISDPDHDWLSGDLDTHGSHPFMNLFEGNIVGKLAHDNTWGSSSHNTTFRSWILNDSSQTTDPTYGRYAVDIQAHSYSNNVIGCIIGQPGDSGVRYLSNGQSGQCSYRLGFPGPSDGNLSDLAVSSSTMLHGNFDYIGGDIVWDVGNPDHALPESLYLQSKPDWFGDSTWPPIDPANPSSATLTNLPAGYRYVFGKPVRAKLSYSKSGSSLLLSFPSGWTLESATDPAGPWEAIAPAPLNSYAVTLATSRHFYRLHWP
jgi:hypothetical protein